LKECLIPQSTK